MLVLNKADRDSARLGGEVETEVFDLLVNMGATDAQLDFPIIYASAKQGCEYSKQSGFAKGRKRK